MSNIIKSAVRPKTTIWTGSKRSAAVLTGVGIIAAGTAGALAIAGPANAHTPELTCSGNAINLALTNYSAGGHVTGTFDGVLVLAEDFGSTYHQTYAIDTSIDHTYSVVVSGNDGQGDHTFSGKTTELCGYQVTPPATETPTPEPTPTGTPSTPPTEEPTSPPTTPVPPVTAPPTSQPTTGPTIAPVPSGGPTPGTSAPVPTATDSSSPVPATEPAGPVAAGASRADSLAFTGPSRTTRFVLLGGLVLLASGIGLMFLDGYRRRRAGTES